jgi:tRNA(Ile)-lysidine synthase
MKSDLPTRVTERVTETVVQAIARHRMFRAGERIGVAVSGGADSVALLRLLDDLRSSLGIKLAVLHFNHQLRGAESDGDERFVASLAAELNFELFAGREDVAAVARAQGWNLEDAARRLRYAFFSWVVDAGHVARVAVAHTADDQAETVLARIVRGTGPAGLAAIYPVKDCVVRPLLAIRRHELRAFIKQRGQMWREDSSNQDATRLRAKLRQQILPVLEREMQPAVVAHLGRLAQMAREDEAFWTALIGERLQALTRPEAVPGGSGAILRRRGIRCADLLAPLPWIPMGGQMSGTLGGRDAAPAKGASFALAKRLVRGIVEDVRGDCRQITAQHIEQVLQLATMSSSGHRAELPGIIVERNFDWLWFGRVGGSRVGGHMRAAVEEGQSEAFSRVIDLGPVGKSTDVVIPEINARFSLKVIDWPVSPRENVTAFDRDLLHPPLVLRNWRPGDSFRPQGRRSVHKLKHFLRTHRVDMRDRAGWPVLTSAGALVWARGMPVAAEVVPRLSTRTGVLIVEEQI